MGLYDRTKGSYHNGIFSKLASKSNVNIEIANLKDIYDKQVKMIGETFDKIDFYRDTMVEKQSQIRTMNNEINVRKMTFKIATDTLIREKFNSLADGIDISYISGLVNKYNTNLFNHKDLADGEIEWERLTSHIPSSLGINWFSCKLNDRNVLNKLNNILHIVKVNNINGKTVEDYIQSNLILEIFICSVKGITWLKLGKNSTFGYNVIVKYQSKKNNFNAKIVSENYNNYKEFDINNFDLDMIIDLGFIENDIIGTKGNNIHIKMKTNIPSSMFGGQHQYFVSSNDKFNDYNEKKAINSLVAKYHYFDNKDIMLYHRENTSLADMNNMNVPSFKSRMIINANAKYIKSSISIPSTCLIHNEISTSLTSSGRVRLNNTVIKNGEVLIGTKDIVSGVRFSGNINKFINNDFFDYKDRYNNLCDKDYLPLYNSNESVVDFFDYHNIGTPKLFTKNENMYNIDSIARIGGNVVITNDINQKNFISERILSNKLSNNKLIDFYSSKSINTGKSIPIGGVNVGEINFMCKTSVGVFACTNNGIREFDMTTGNFKFTTVSSGKFGKMVELSDGFIAVITLDNNGIYKYDRFGSTDTMKSFIKSNIVTGTFSDIAINNDDLYAISNSGVYEPIGDNKHRLLTTLYKYRDGNIVSFENLLSLEFNNDESIMVVDGEDFFSNESETLNEYKLININGKFAILKTNPSNEYQPNNLFLTGGDNEFGYFKSINSIIRDSLGYDDSHEFIVDDVMNCSSDYNQIYISFGIYNNTEEMISEGIIKYRPSDNNVRLLETQNVNIVNNREYIERIYVINGTTINTDGESEPLVRGQLFDVNGKVFVIPRSSYGLLTDDIEYCNGFYYITIDDYKVYKLNHYFKIVDEYEFKGVNKTFNINNFLIMNGRELRCYTDTLSVLSYPELIYNDDIFFEGNKFKTKVLVKQ